MKRIKNNWFEFLMTSPRAKIFRHLLLQILILLLSMNAFGSEYEVFIFTPKRFFAWLSFYAMLNIIFYFNIYVLTPCLLLRGKIGRYILIIITISIALLIFIILTQTISENIEPTDFSPSFVLLELTASTLSFALVTVATSSMTLFVRWMEEQKRVNELKVSTNQTELKLLKQQINPHFLFNMLNNANVLLKRAPKEASQVLFELKELLNYQLNDSTKDLVKLDSDISFLNDFLRLEKIRRDHFEYSIIKKGETSGISIPPMLFIPFVENAIKHNPDNDKESYVHIAFKVTGNELYFRCENSKPAIAPAKNKVGGLGLNNIRRRLELLYPTQHTLSITDDEKYFIVELNIKS